MIYMMGMSHILPVLDACSATGLQAQIGLIANPKPPAFVDWALAPDQFPHPLRVANLYARQVAPHWGSTLAVQTEPRVVAMAPGFQQLLGTLDAAGGRNTLFTFIHGEEHIHLALRERPDPFDFELPDRPDLALLPGRQVLPLAVAERMVEYQLARTRAILMAVRAAQADLRVVNVVCPPTNRTVHWDPGPGGERSDTMALTPLSVRLKVYLLYAQLLRRATTGWGIDSLAPPAGTVSDDGYLRDEFAADSVHGNKRYGEQVVQQMNALL